MSMWGADVDALEALARQVAGKAEQLDAVRQSVRVMLYASPWTGADAEGFRLAWDGEHAASFASAVAALHQVSTVLAQNAESAATGVRDR